MQLKTFLQRKLNASNNKFSKHIKKFNNLTWKIVQDLIRTKEEKNITGLSFS